MCRYCFEVDVSGDARIKSSAKDNAFCTSAPIGIPSPLFLNSINSSSIYIYCEEDWAEDAPLCNSVRHFYSLSKNAVDAHSSV